MVTGLINQRIEIYENANQLDGHAGVVQNINPTPYWTTSAEVTQLRSSRSLEANQTELKPVFNFKVRYRDDKNILDDMLVKWRGTYFVIQGYVPGVVYKERVSFDATAFKIGDLVAGTKSPKFTVRYGFYDTEPNTGDISFQFQKELDLNVQEINLDFTEAAQGKFIAISIPNTQINPTTWFNYVLNNGQIPDSVFKSPVFVTGNNIIVSRSAFIFEDENYNIKFT